MRILDRYVVIRFLAALSFALLVLLAIYILANLVENLDKFLDAHATLDQVFRYYLNFVPQITVIMLPIGILLATLFSMGALSKSNELMAMSASGIPLHRTAIPLLVLGFLLSLVLMGLNESIVPITNQKRWEINEYEIHKKKQDRRQIMYHVYRQGEEGRIFRLERYDILGRHGFGVMVQQFDDSRLTWTMKAEEMQMTDSVWHFKRGDIRTFVGSDSMDIQSFDSLLRPDWNESPQSFAQQRKLPENMGYMELSRWVEFKERAGADATKELVALQVKLAFPFACLIMVVIAIPIASSPKRAGFARSFGIAFGIMFVYFTLSRSLYKLGEAGDIPGLVAAWSVNILFLIVGVLLYAFVRK